MPVHILKVSAKNLGPIDQLSIEPGIFNLIYGRNEVGKTYLVEFLLRSLFKSAANWRLRSVTESGRVMLGGLGEDPVDFSPAGETKLEDYWGDPGDGLPLNMARLLVVKGAELSMAHEHPAGINKAVLKEFLSSEAVLDEIQGRISKTVQDASIEGDRIEGHHRGEIRQREELSEGLTRIDALFEGIEQEYSAGRRADLEEKADSLREELELQDHGRRHQAYGLAERIADLEGKAAAIPADELESLRDAHRDLRGEEHKLAEKEAELAGLKAVKEDYQWVKQALGVYPSLEDAEGTQAVLAFVVLAAVFLLAAIISSFLRQPWIAAFFALLSAAFATLYLIPLRRQALTRGQREELARVQEEFQERFEADLASLPTLRAKGDDLEEKFIRYQSLEEQAAESRDRVAVLKADVRGYLESIVGVIPAEEDWGESVAELRERRKRLLEEIQSLKLELEGLNVPPADYLEREPAFIYDPRLAAELEARLREIEAELQSEVRSLDTLKQRICQETGEDISASWEDLIIALQERREAVSTEYRRVTAGILGGIHLNQVIVSLREVEDAKIRERLASEAVLAPLYQVTQRYTGLELRDDQLMVSDEYDTFRLAEISTGAQEQVLLALRVGFAAMLMEDRRAFLILDDAFQHADWVRREFLLEQVLELARVGWQILYFSMDDHLRDLVSDRGAAEFGDGFRRFELPEP